jgi:hypothetical protein
LGKKSNLSLLLIHASQVGSFVAVRMALLCRGSPIKLKVHAMIKKWCISKKTMGNLKYLKNQETKSLFASAI